MHINIDREIDFDMDYYFLSIQLFISRFFLLTIILSFFLTDDGFRVEIWETDKKNIA